jgi:hypothetical protein
MMLAITGLAMTGQPHAHPYRQSAASTLSISSLAGLFAMALLCLVFFDGFGCGKVHKQHVGHLLAPA